MTTERTNTSDRILVPEDHYEAMINKVDRKEIKGGYIIYEWNFEALVKEKTFYFKIGMFSSQMAELLRAIGAKEVSPNDFEWDRELVKGLTMSFNVVHTTDKKGVIREQLSDIKLLSAPTKQEKQDIAWGDDNIGGTDNK